MPTTPTALFMTAAFVLATAPLAQAIPLPPVGAHADARAMTPGDDAGTVTDDGASSALATNSAAGTGVADAFSQALPNPLLQARTWNKDTFSRRGWEIINEEEQTIEALLKRNTPELSSAARDALSIFTHSMVQRI